jgi:hypothetical protein
VRAVDDVTLESHIRQLIEEQLASEAAGGRDEYEFRHALTREVVYDDLLVRERKRLHRSVADTLAMTRGTEPALLAHHLLAAGDSERAVPVLIEAADRAIHADAPREAAAHYARAIEIGLPDARLVSVIERQAEAYQSFDTSAAIKTSQEALALYRQLGDRGGQSRMLRLEGRGQFYESRPDLAEQRTQESIDVLDGEECVELARAIAQLAGLLMARQAMLEAAPVAERAIAMGERLNDPWTVANALITQGSVLRGEQGLPALRRGLDVALRSGIIEAAQRAYNNIQLSLITVGASATERARLLAEGLEHARRHGTEEASLSYLLNMKSFLEFGSGEWDAMLVTVGRMHEASMTYRWALVLRAWVVAARDGPAAALPMYTELAGRSRGDVGARITSAASLAAGFADAGRIGEARANLVALHEMIAPYQASSGELETPRSLIGAPALFDLLIASALLEEPRWIDLADAEIGKAALSSSSRQCVTATRALLAGDPATCGRALDAAYAAYEHVGFAGNWHRFAVACVRIASERGHVLGAEWAVIAPRTRTFAERAGAKWWLEVLGKAGL